MTELTTRPYADGDAAAIAAMMNLVEVDSGAYPMFTEAEVTTTIAGWVRDPRRNTRLSFAADGTLVAVGMVGAPPAGGLRADTFGGVHPRWQGRGLGHELLTWQLGRIGEIHDETAPDAEWSVDAASSAQDEGAAHLYENFGMQPVRYFFDMQAELDAAPAVAVPHGMRVVGYAPELLDRLYAAHVEAFSDHWGFQQRPRDQWVTSTVEAVSFRADLSVLAYDGDEVAGYVLAYDGADNMHYIGQVGTRRPWRRRGLAGALVAHTMAAAAATGKTRATLGVDADSPTGAVGVYERVGFSVHARFVAYRRPLRVEPTAD